jgi:hypothetical protein
MEGSHIMNGKNCRYKKQNSKYNIGDVIEYFDRCVDTGKKYKKFGIVSKVLCCGGPTYEVNPNPTESFTVKEPRILRCVRTAILDKCNKSRVDTEIMLLENRNPDVVFRREFHSNCESWMVCVKGIKTITTIRFCKERYFKTKACFETYIEEIENE